MKSLAKDRTRRYQTTGDFVRDIEHYLHNESVEARPPSLIDRLAKWSQRHRKLVWASVAVLGVLVVGSLISALLLTNAYRREKMQRIAAQNNETRAVAGESLAMKQTAETERQRDTAERSLYVASMQIASRDFVLGQTSAVNSVLEAQITKPGRPDFRGWEWYYLFSQCHGCRLALLHQNPGLCWSPDGKSLATTDRIGGVNVWDAISGERKASLKGALHYTWCLAWSPDGQYLAAGNGPGTVEIWDVGSGNKVRSLRGGGAGVGGVAWSSDGLKLAAGEMEGTTWSYSPGGPVGLIGMGPENTTIRIWDWRAGKEVTTTPGCPGECPRWPGTRTAAGSWPFAVSLPPAMN